MVAFGVMTIRLPNKAALLSTTSQLIAPGGT